MATSDHASGLHKDSQAKIDGVFALRQSNAKPCSTQATSDTRARVDSVFALRSGKTERSSKLDAIFGCKRDAPSRAASDSAARETITPAAPRQPATAASGLAQNDWTRMSDTDVTATAAYAVSVSRDAAQATAFMVRRAASNPAFKQALAPQGIQAGQALSDLCRPTIAAAMQSRGWS